MPLRRSGTSFHYLFAASCSVSSMLLSIQYPKIERHSSVPRKEGAFFGHHKSPPLTSTGLAITPTQRKPGKRRKKKKKKPTVLCACKLSQDARVLNACILSISYSIATRSPHWQAALSTALIRSTKNSPTRVTVPARAHTCTW